jgi:hypothetical protein
LAFRADTLEEHDKLKFEEDYRVDGRSSTSGIEWSNKVTHEVEVKGSMEVTVEIVGRDKVLQRDIDQGREVTVLATHHE